MGHSPNAVSMLRIVEDGGTTLKQHCVNTLSLLDSQVDHLIQRPTYLQHNAQQTLHSTQCRVNAGPPLPTLAINHLPWTVLTVGGVVSTCVHRVQADTDPISVKCWASVAGAGHISGSMVGLCSIDYTSTML